MPWLRPVAPVAMSERSIKSVRRPRIAQSRCVPAPVMPPPMMMTSNSRASITIRLDFFFGAGLGIFDLADRVAGQADAQLLEGLAVHFGQHHGGVHLGAGQLGELVEGHLALLVHQAEDGDRDQDFVGVQARVVAVQVVDFGLLDGGDHHLGDELDVVGDAREVLQGVEQQGRAGTEQGRGLRREDGAVFELDGRGGAAALLEALVGGDRGLAVGGGDAGFLHHEGELVDFGLGGFAVGELAQGGVVAPDDLLEGGLAADFVVADAGADHIDAHVGGRFVRRFAVDVLEEGVHHREDLDVAVVVDRGLAVGFEVERVDHVDVVQVGRGGFVGDVDGVVEREAPHGEGLEFGVAGLEAALVFLVELAEADGHLAAAGAGGRDDDEGLGGLHIIVLAESFVGVDEGDVVGIAFDGIVVIDLDAHALEALAVGVGAALAVVVGDDDAVDAEVAGDEFVAEAEDVYVVGDAEVVADLVFLDVHRTDDDDDLEVVLQCVEHFEFAVRLEPGEHPAGVVVVEELAAEFHVKLVAELGDALFDALRLDLQIFVVVVPVFHLRIALNTGYKFTSFCRKAANFFRPSGEFFTAPAARNSARVRRGSVVRSCLPRGGTPAGRAGRCRRRGRGPGRRRRRILRLPFGGFRSR